MLDLVGFAGSGLIIVSVTMRSIIRLRILGLLGSAAFICYGISLQAWPVVATNMVTTCIHLHHLRLLIKEHLASDRERSASAVEPALDSGFGLSRTVGAGGLGV